MGNISSLLVILLSFIAAYFLRFDNVNLTNTYLVVLLVGLLISSVILPR